jgi:hypothetical protein
MMPVFREPIFILPMFVFLFSLGCGFSLVLFGGKCLYNERGFLGAALILGGALFGSLGCVLAASISLGTIGF